MQQLVVFSLGTEEYGLPITAVQEIIRYRAAAHHPVVAALGARRDQPARQDHPGLRPEAASRADAEEGEEGKIVIVEAGPVTAGLIVDEVEEVLTVEQEQLEDRPVAERRLHLAPWPRSATACWCCSTSTACSQRRGQRHGVDRRLAGDATATGPRDEHRHPTAPAMPVTAVVCDDSAFMRRFLLRTRSTRDGVRRGRRGRDRAPRRSSCAARARPDVLTLDMQMPGICGMDVLRQLPPGGPGVIVVSAYTSEGSALAVEALSIGAAEVVRKPALGRLDGRLRGRARRRGAGRCRRRRGDRRPPAARPATAPCSPTGARAPQRPAPARSGARIANPLVLIASSTGGPRALARARPEPALARAAPAW